MVDLYDEVPLWSAPFGWKLLDKINYPRNIIALDIGFGTGFPLIEIAMRLGNSSVIYGIDPWKEGIERTMRKIAFYGITNIHVLQGEAENIPLSAGSVNLVTSNNGLNNVQDPEKVFSECARVLKSGGQFVQTMNLDKTMIEFYDAFEKVLASMNMEKEIDLMHQHIYEKRRPLEEIVDLTEKNGFIIKSVDHHHFNYRFADSAAFFSHFFIRLAFKDSWKKLVPENYINIFDKTKQIMDKQLDISGCINLSVPFVVLDAVRR